MRRRIRIALVTFAGVVLLLIGVACVINATATFPQRLAFTPGDGSITPIFVVVTQGERHTNYTSTTAGKKMAQICYVHTFYYASQNSIQPTSPLRYWTGYYVARTLPRLVQRDRFFGSKTDDFAGSRFVLWLGYRATNSIWSEQAVLVSEQGSRFELTSRGEDSLTNSEHLVNWEVPAPLTNHGKYRLILPKQNRTLLTFVYD